jgi:hypothetical protein
MWYFCAPKNRCRKILMLIVSRCNNLERTVIWTDRSGIFPQVHLMSQHQLKSWKQTYNRYYQLTNLLSAITGFLIKASPTSCESVQAGDHSSIPSKQHCRDCSGRFAVARDLNSWILLFDALGLKVCYYLAILAIAASLGYSDCGDCIIIEHRIHVCKK